MLRASRRRLPCCLAGLVLVGWAAFLARCSQGWAPTARIEGRIVGSSIALGHRLAAGLAPALGAPDGARVTGPPRFPPPARSEEVGVVIVGGGMAGLTAGWRLLKSGWSDFALLELEGGVGGNARSATMRVGPGRGQQVAHPWAAHYVPVPSAQNDLLRGLLAEAGAVRAGGAGARGGGPAWEASLLCPLPVERLFAPDGRGGGRWLECPDGLLPSHLLDDEDRRQLALLRDAVRAEAAGGPGRFAVPLAHSAVDARARELDGTSALAWLGSVGVTSPGVLWFAQYGLRDDYGVELGDASAWALVHYFAARATDERLEAQGGNGWLVDFLARAAGPRARTGALVFSVEPRGGGSASVRYWDVGRQQAVQLLAKRVIYAAPRFTAPHVVAGYAPEWLGNFTYAPWVVANVGLRRPPPEQAAAGWLRGWLRGAGAGGGSAAGYATCDSVVYDGPGGAQAGEAGASLGYALSTTAALRERLAGGWSLRGLLRPWARPEGSAAVLTHYTALTALPPAQARAWLLGTSWAYWRERVLSELELPHPQIRSLATRVDVAFLAHAMVRPTVGFIWGEARRLAAQPFAGVVHWAHSDMSGLSLIEEAVHWGARAAEAVLLELTGTTAAPLTGS